jgi:hypothetical protein
MTATREPSDTQLPAPDGSPVERCSQCGLDLAADQEWCLECGGARTLIHRPPDWRIAAAIVASVILLVLIGVGIALVNLSSNADRGAAAQAVRTVTVQAAQTQTAPATTAQAAPATTTQTGPATTTQAAPAATTQPSPAAQIANWPVGLPGWTVVLASTRSQSSAQSTASSLGATGLPVGILSSSEHGAMAPGFWIVFSGRYPTQAAAQAKAAALAANGHPSAQARLVERPGG